MTKKVPVSPVIATARGALMAYLLPRLAQDEQIDLGKVLRGVNAKNFKQSLETIEGRLLVATKGKLAQDADVHDVVDLLKGVSGAPAEMEQEESEDSDNLAPVDPEDTNAMVSDNDPTEAVTKILEAAGVAPEVMQAVCEAMKPAAAQAEGEHAEEAAKQDVLNEDEDPHLKPDTYSKPAMDAAIAKASREAEQRTIDRLNGIFEARQKVRPLVGDITVAMDSADAVYRYALDKSGVSAKGVHASALPTMVDMVLKRETAPRSTQRIAQDENPEQRAQLFGPHVNRVRVIG